MVGLPAGTETYLFPRKNGQVQPFPDGDESHEEPGSANHGGFNYSPCRYGFLPKPTTMPANSGLLTKAAYLATPINSYEACLIVNGEYHIGGFKHQSRGTALEVLQAVIKQTLFHNSLPPDSAVYEVEKTW